MSLIPNILRERLLVKCWYTEKAAYWVAALSAG